MKGSSFKYLLKEGVKNIWSNRMMSIASVAVLICCLILTGAAALFSMNVDALVKDLEASNSVRVYLKDELSTLQSIQLGEEIKKLDNVAECVFIPKDEAIQEYIDILDNEGEILAGLTGEDNPLPNAYQVSFTDLSIYRETAEQITQIDGVLRINDYSDMAAKLTVVDNFVLYGGIAVVAFLAAVSLLIISNTVRVTMHSRRLEISIMKSVGATSMFIRIPFLVEGVILGLLSGGISCTLLLVAYHAALGAVSGILPSFHFVPMGSVLWWVIAGALIIGALFGLSGGLLSIRRYLKRQGGDALG